MDPSPTYVTGWYAGDDKSGAWERKLHNKITLLFSDNLKIV